MGTEPFLLGEKTMERSLLTFGMRIVFIFFPAALFAVSVGLGLKAPFALYIAMAAQLGTGILIAWLGYFSKTEAFVDTGLAAVVSSFIMYACVQAVVRDLIREEDSPDMVIAGLVALLLVIWNILNKKNIVLGLLQELLYGAIFVAAVPFLLLGEYRNAAVVTTIVLGGFLLSHPPVRRTTRLA